MATLRQKKLARNIIENVTRDKPLNKQELVVSSGYGVVTADRHAGEVMEQKGVKEELLILGFDPDTAKKVVSDILRNEKHAPKDRLRAASEVFKVHGTYAAEKHVNLNIDMEDSEAIKHLTETLNEIHGGTSIGSDGTPSGAVGKEVQD